MLEFINVKCFNENDHVVAVKVITHTGSLFCSLGLGWMIIAWLSGHALIFRINIYAILNSTYSWSIHFSVYSWMFLPNLLKYVALFVLSCCEKKRQKRNNQPTNLHDAEKFHISISYKIKFPRYFCSQNNHTIMIDMWAILCQFLSRYITNVFYFFHNYYQSKQLWLLLLLSVLG